MNGKPNVDGVMERGKKDWYERTLLKLRRKYSKDEAFQGLVEVIQTINRECDKLQFQLHEKHMELKKVHRRLSEKGNEIKSLKEKIEHQRTEIRNLHQSRQ